MHFTDPDLTNMCIPDLLSTCTAGTRWKDQKFCKFYRKATFSERCMHFVEAIDDHCDNVDAQRDGRR